MEGRPIRVCFVIAETTGGIGRHVHSLASKVAEHDVEVIVCGPSATLNRLGFDPKVQLFQAPVGEFKPGALAKTTRTLRSLFRETDVIHAHGLKAGIAACTASSARPVVTTWHNAPQGSRVRRTLHASLEHIVARQSALTLVVSGDLAERAHRAGARKIELVFAAAPAIVPNRNATETRRTLGLKDGQATVLAVGRLAAQKRFDLLIDAIARQPWPSTVPLVLIAGEGELRGSLETQIQATGAPVRLLGARDDIADLMSVADAVVVTSDWEGCPLVVQEAMRLGVPLISTAVGGIPALVGEAAELVEPNNAEAIGTALARVLGDSDLRATLAVLERHQAASWPSEEDVLERLVATYRTLVTPQPGVLGG